MALEAPKNLSDYLNKNDLFVGLGAGTLAVLLSGADFASSSTPFAVGLAGGALGIFLYEMLTAEFPRVHVFHRINNEGYTGNNNTIIDPTEIVTGQKVESQEIAPGVVRVKTMNSTYESANFLLQESHDRRHVF